MRLIGQDCAVQITDGGAQDGTPTYGSAVPLKAFAKRVMVEDSLETVDMRALGDSRRKLRGKFGSTTCEVELEVQDTGMLSLTIGNYVKLEIKEISSLASFKPFAGLLTKNRLEIPDGEELQVLTIECDAE